jgi:4-amino-4-deoxy-L-arabinose transferase-like glycosyltransferase
MQRTRLRLNIILIIIFFSLAAFQQAYRIGSESIKIWDESSGAQNAIEMMTNKKFFIVYSDGKPDHLDVKPPLALWLKIISYKIFGINEFSVRFPTIVAFWMIMLFIVLFAVYFLKIPEIAWITLLIAASSRGFIIYHIARHGDPDTLLTMFVTGYLLCFFIVLEKYPHSYIKYLIITGLSVIGAVYTKSIAGIAPLAGIALYTLFHKKGRQLLTRPSFYLTLGSVILIILAYYIGRELSDPGYLKSVFKYEINVLSEYPGKVPKHPEFGYYFNFLWEKGFRPWIYFIPVSILALIFSNNQRNKRLILYLLTGASVYLMGQSAALMKNHWYIAPVYPFLWLLLAVSFYEIFMLILKWFKPLSLKIIVSILLFFIPVFLGTRMYIKMLNYNYIIPGGYIYEPERTGNYLKHIKNAFPEFKDLIALTTEHQRQLKFYAKKYQYEDSTSVEITRSLNPDMVKRKVFVTDSVNRKLLIKAFNVSLLDSAKYGRLYQVEGIKDSTLIYRNTRN